MKDAIRNYIQLLESPPASVDERLPALAKALDWLANEIHELPEGDIVEPSKERPNSALNSEYEHFYALASAAFPQLGYYPLVDALGEIVGQEPMVGDAIDDIADIAHDLMNGLWEWENNGPDQGAWQVHLDYGVHWGVHLHRLRLYLHLVINRG